MSISLFRFRVLCTATAAICLSSVPVQGQGQGQNQNQGQQNQGQQTTGGGGGGGNQTQPQLGSITESTTIEFGTLTEQMGTGFIGQGNTETFVGANQAAQNAGQAQNRNFQPVNQGQNPNQFNQNLPTTTGTGVGAIRYRPPFKLAFDMPRPTSRNVDLNLTRKIRNLTSKKPMFAAVAFVVSEPNTVTLTGTVKSEADRQLAQLYMKMEPGVDKVIDQLTVEPETIQGRLLELPEE
ncbi:MAG TPA: BON domain-containing protein [Planctomycetaceae bacterium]|nr:BON domain-containing protein [Planctomycetaceae bacterium]